MLVLRKNICSIIPFLYLDVAALPTAAYQSAGTYPTMVQVEFKLLLLLVILHPLQSASQRYTFDQNDERAIKIVITTVAYRKAVPNGPQ